MSKMTHNLVLNPFTHMGNQDRISPYNINTILSRQVMRIKKNINMSLIIIFVPIPSSLNQRHKNWMAGNKENYVWDLRGERVYKVTHLSICASLKVSLTGYQQSIKLLLINFKSDQNLIPLYNDTTESFIEIMRTVETIANLRSLIVRQILLVKTKTDVKTRV